MKKLLLLTIIFTTGCTKYTELNDLAIIKSIGISYNKEYTLYAEIIDEIKDDTPKMKVIKTSGKDIKTIFNNIKLLVNKEIYFSHIDLIVLDFNLQNNNYEELINYFLNNKEFRNDFLCIFSNDIETILTKQKYDEIEELIITNKESKKVIKISFEEIIKNFLDNKEFTLSNIIYKDGIKFDGNYTYKNNEVKNEKDRT